MNDCVVLRDSQTGEYADLSKCPECDEDRYEPGTMIQRKRFKYMPLENRVRRLFANDRTSQLLQTHSLSGLSVSSVVCDIHQSETWKSWYSPTGVFKGDHHGLSFAITLPYGWTFHVKSHHTAHVQYSWWFSTYPITSACYLVL